jgi:hypothetical protein
VDRPYVQAKSQGTRAPGRDGGHRLATTPGSSLYIHLSRSDDRLSLLFDTRSVTTISFFNTKTELAGRAAG